MQFSLKAKGTGDFKGVEDSNLTIPLSNLKVKDSSVADYTAMSTDDSVLLAGQTPTSGRDYSINMKLDIGWGIKPDSYSTNLIFAAEQE